MNYVFGNRVAMSVCLSVCAIGCSFFSRPLIGLQITYDQILASHWSTLLPYHMVVVVVKIVSFIYRKKKIKNKNKLNEPPPWQSDGAAWGRFWYQRGLPRPVSIQPSKSQQQQHITSITFDQYLLNFRSNVHVNLVYLISLLLKKAIIHFFLWPIPYFLCKKKKK